MKKKAAVINLGCPKNQVDSEVITGILSKSFDITGEPSQANLIIVNTCGFIETAKEESIDVIYEMVELKEKGICEKVYATGCLAQRYGQELIDEIPELDGVLGDGDLLEIVSRIEQSPEEKLFIHKANQDFLYSHEMPRILMGSSFFAFIKIAEGCDNCCTYCAIPSIKGNYRSRRKESVLEEIRQLASQGVKEIALVAQDTTRYGLDIYGEPMLPSLLKEIVKIQGIEWIRLLYCYPDAFTDELIEVISQEKKICKYVDLPLQHADNQILSEMNRRNTAEEAERLILKLRQFAPGITIRSTFITGFPGETEEQFQNLYHFVQKMKFERLGIFAYSQEENTPAGRRSDQLPLEVREDRKDRIMALQAEISFQINQSKVGKTIPVILEEELSDGYWIGRTEGDAPEIDGQIYVTVQTKHVPGDFVDTTILQADSYDLKGEGHT